MSQSPSEEVAPTTTLTTTDSPHNALPPPAANETEHTDDERYLLDHGIPFLFDRMIQDLLSVKPKDTNLWMLDWFQSQEDVMSAYHAAQIERNIQAMAAAAASSSSQQQQQ
eukprot:PhM_4_TR15273/c0_g1_i1/m.30351